jgi:putative transposase
MNRRISVDRTILLKCLLSSFWLFIGLIRLYGLLLYLSLKIWRCPEKLNMVFDGNPIYLLAQHFFASHGIHFDVTQVIGLTNDDPVSEEYRPLKQVIERLNRTLKRYYKSTNGFGAFDNCQNYLTLFTTWHNFLRPHKSLGYRVPVNIPGVTKLPNMPAKWLELLDMAQYYILEHQAA